MPTTSESFVLKTSGIPASGLGVFTTHDIEPGAYLAFKPKNTTIGIVRPENEIPVKFLSYCIARDDGQYLCPADFENIETIWYLNHSGNPNAEQRSDGYYATSYIPAGEEILIDYNSLDEPEDKKEDFYHS